jgi:hypothetical protein
MRHTGLRIGVGYADFTFQAVGITEEQAENLPEVGDEGVGSPSADQAITDGLERVNRRSLETEMIEATPPETGRLALGLGVAVDLEDVQLRCRSDVDDGQANSRLPGLFWTVTKNFGIEDVSVEGTQPIGVIGQERDVVDSLGEHVCLLWLCREVRHCTGDTGIVRQSMIGSARMRP